MSKGKPGGLCRTCDCEIVEFVNDGVFGSGDCSYCEQNRYETQPKLLDTLITIRNMTESLDYDDDNIDSELDAKTAAFDEIRDLAYAVINECRTNPSATA